MFTPEEREQLRHSLVERGRADGRVTALAHIGSQARYMLNGLRDRIRALACLRHGLPPHRGGDELSAHVTERLFATLTGSLDRAALLDAFAAAVDALLMEARYFDSSLADALRIPLQGLVDSVGEPFACG